ncbi:hypothetical protein Tco_0745406 [Tanacetum coccineum]
MVWGPEVEPQIEVRVSLCLQNSKECRQGGTIELAPNTVTNQQGEDVTGVGSNQRNNGQGMPSRRDNQVSTRGRNNSQQAEDVIEVGSNQPNNGQVLWNARKRVKGPTFMPKV